MRIIITDCDHDNINEEDKVFKQNNFEYEYKNCLTEEELIKECKGGQVFVNQYAPFTRKAIEALSPELKQIVRYGVGVNNVDVEAATEFGVKVCNVPDYGTNEVADHAVALALGLSRKVTYLSNYTKKENWDYTKGIPIFRLQEQTVGIVGLGRIGKTFGKRMKAFDMKVIACDTNYNVGDVVDDIEIVSFEKLIEISDIVSIHCPLDSETRDMFNLDVFKKMKNTSYLVNVARGGIINENDLYIALKDKLIAGAGLDVVDKEPMLPGVNLFELENFLCTPHIAWYSESSSLELKRKVAQEACRFVLGEEIHYPVN